MVEFKRGLISRPTHLSLPDFIFSEFGQEENLQDIPSISILTLADLIQEYQRITAPPIKAVSTYSTDTIHLNHLRQFMEQKGYTDILLKQVNIGFFDRYKAFRYGQNVRTDTVKKELGTFQSMFQMAVNHEYISQNVLKNVKRDESQIPNERFRTQKEIEECLKYGDYNPKEIKEIRRFRYLTPEEIKELLVLTRDSWLYPILALCACTGIRRGEIVKIEWADVDLTRKLLWIRSQKQSKTRIEVRRCVDISEELLAVLKIQHQKTGKQRWVFLSPKGHRLTTGTLRENLRRVLNGTKFEGCGYHMFRHSLASNLAAQGVDQRVIDNILGHQTEEMRERYRHLFPQTRREAMNKLSYL